MISRVTCVAIAKAVRCQCLTHVLDSVLEQSMWYTKCYWGMFPVYDSFSLLFIHSSVIVVNDRPHHPARRHSLVSHLGHYP